MGNKVFDSVTILDLTRYLPGGYSTQVFADFGAKVIKVEDTNTGDFCRREPPLNNGASYYFTALGRNKKSISINLKNSDALQAFYWLVHEADVVIESFRPSVTKKLKIDYDTLREINPQLIYCSLSGYGQNDPRSLEPLHDLNMQAQSGYLSLNGGVKAPLHLCDLATAMVSCQSLLVALYDREKTNKGRYIDISMFDSFVWWNSMLDSRWFFQDQELSESTIAYPDSCPFYNIFETKDNGKLSVSLVEDKFWNSFCDLVEKPELKDRSKEGTYEKTKEIFSSKTLSEWMEWLKDKELCIAPIIDKTEAIDQIATLEPNMISYVEFPSIGTVLQTNLPHAITGLQPKIKEFSPPPKLGEHSREILREAGFTNEKIEALIKTGVIRDTE